MVHPGPGVGVGDGRVNWYQVHIMHSDIITVFATLQESNIDQRRSVKPTGNMMYTSSLITDPKGRLKSITSTFKFQYYSIFQLLTFPLTN